MNGVGKGTRMWWSKDATMLSNEESAGRQICRLAKISGAKQHLKKLHRAAKAFTDKHGPSILDEFGLQLQCEYKGQDETMERDPASWTVQGRRSHCKVVFEISLPGVVPLLSEPVRFDNIDNMQRTVPFPKDLATQLRCREA